MKTAKLETVIAAGPVPVKQNRRRAYGWQFTVTGRIVTDFATIREGDVVRAQYLGGNGILQVEHRKALGITAEDGYDVSVQIVA
ncbi:MAG: hypothetical protein WC711_00415 [Candidatus Staskawiczbacteria bacterium]